MVNGKRIDVIEDDPAVAHAKALAVKAGLMEEQKPVAELTVGQAIDRYIDSKDAVLSPSTIAGYRRIRANLLQGIIDIRISSLTQEAVQREINHMARIKSPKTIRNAHGLLSAALSIYRPDFVLRTTMPQRQRYEAAIPSGEDIENPSMGSLRNMDVWENLPYLAKNFSLLGISPIIKQALDIL